MITTAQMSYRKDLQSLWSEDKIPFMGESKKL